MIDRNTQLIYHPVAGHPRNTFKDDVDEFHRPICADEKWYLPRRVMTRPPADAPLEAE
jgi:hypothetical protein